MAAASDFHKCVRVVRRWLTVIHTFRQDKNIVIFQKDSERDYPLDRSAVDLTLLTEDNTINKTLDWAYYETLALSALDTGTVCT